MPEYILLTRPDQIDFPEDVDKQAAMAEEGSKLSLAGALTFLKVITEEADRLRVFFEPKSAGGPSSRGNTELTFST